MTRLAWLAVAPVVIVGALLAAVALTHHHPAVVHGAAIFAYGVSSLASVLAAYRFGARERVGRAWILMAVASGLGFIQALFFGVSFHGSGASQPLAIRLIRLGIVIALNVADVCALALFTRVWNDTGLVPKWRRLATIISVVVALGIAGPAAVGDVRNVSVLGLGWAASLTSDLGDIVGIALMGPVLATAIAMRGGLLVWPWALLFCNSFIWLLYDAGGRLPPSWRTTTDFAMSLLAHLFLAAAALAHVQVVAAVRNHDHDG